MTARLTRRRLLAGASGLLAAPHVARAAPVLRVGDQRGGVRALMEAAAVLHDTPYRLAWSEFPAAAPLLEAARAEAIDSGYVGDAPFTFAFANGAPVRAIATRRTGQEGTAIVVPGDSPAHRFADLRGKRIATGRGSIGHFLLLAALERDKLATSDVRIVFLQPADAHAALAAGAIDAWSTWEPYTSQVEVVDHGRRVTSGAGLTPGLGYQVATTAALAGQEAALGDFVRRLAQARHWADAHPDQYAAYWAKLMNFPLDVPLHWFRRTPERIIPVDADVLRDEQRVIDVYARAGLLQPFKAEAAIDARFDDAIRQGNAVPV